MNADKPFVQQSGLYSFLIDEDRLLFAFIYFLVLIFCSLDFLGLALNLDKTSRRFFSPQNPLSLLSLWHRNQVMDGLSLHLSFRIRYQSSPIMITHL